jgi:Ca2+-binding EF-hand superfamily protein
MSISVVSASSSSYWDELLEAMQEAKKTQDGLAQMLFGDLDGDASGGISLEESGLTQEQYDVLDSDKDGVVSLAELENAIAPLQRASLYTLMKLGIAEGSDDPSASGGGESAGAPAGDGNEGAGPAASAAARSVYDAMDANQDGIVSPEELAAALVRRQAAESAHDASGTAFGGARNFLALLAGDAYGKAAGQSPESVSSPRVSATA